MTFLEWIIESKLGELISPRKNGKFVVDPGATDNWAFKHRKIYTGNGAKFVREPGETGWTFGDVDQAKKTIHDVGETEGISPQEIAEAIDELIAEVDIIQNGGEPRELGGPNTTANILKSVDVAKKLKEFKLEIMQCHTFDEFQKRMAPFFAFRAAQYINLSLDNYILAFLQDPEGTSFRSPTRWADEGNRRVIPGAKGVVLFYPVRTHSYNPRQKLRKFMSDQGADADAGNLSADKTAEMMDTISRGEIAGNEIKPYIAYDIRFTKYDKSLGSQKTYLGLEKPFGDKDVFGGWENAKSGQVKWYDDSGEVTQDTFDLIEATRNVAKKHNIDVGEENIMGGARGYATTDGAKIRIKSGISENDSYFSTLVHELTHSLCHTTNAIYKLDATRDVMEQEAQVCAWIVLKLFGFENQTESTMNYIDGWGMNEKNCCIIFDIMSRVAENIYKEIYDEYKAIRAKSIAGKQ